MNFPIQSSSAQKTDTTKDPLEIAPNRLDDETSSLIREGFEDRFASQLRPSDGLSVTAYQGTESAYLIIALGSLDSRMFFHFLVDAVQGEGFDGALGIVLDFAEGCLSEYLESEREAHLPLDFKAYDFEKAKVFAKSDKRNLVAESHRDALLEDQNEAALLET